MMPIEVAKSWNLYFQRCHRLREIVKLENEGFGIQTKHAMAKLAEYGISALVATRIIQQLIDNQEITMSPYISQLDDTVLQAVDVRPVYKLSTIRACFSYRDYDGDIPIMYILKKLMSSKNSRDWYHVKLYMSRLHYLHNAGVLTLDPCQMTVRLAAYTINQCRQQSRLMPLRDLYKEISVRYSKNKQAREDDLLTAMVDNTANSDLVVVVNSSNNSNNNNSSANNQSDKATKQQLEFMNSFCTLSYHGIYQTLTFYSCIYNYIESSNLAFSWSNASCLLHDTIKPLFHRQLISMSPHGVGLTLSGISYVASNSSSDS